MFLLMLICRFGGHMKNFFSFLLITLCLNSIANDEVVLESRYTIGNYTTATYSFMHTTRDDVSLTKNNWEILFEAPPYSVDYFSVDTVVGDNSFIYDLGKKSCKDIKSIYPEEREKRPLAWLAYSDADPSKLNPSKRLGVNLGHCYLTYNNDENGRVIALFKVQEHKINEKVVLSEIEVLDRLRRR